VSRGPFSSVDGQRQKKSREVMKETTRSPLTAGRSIIPNLMQARHEPASVASRLDDTGRGSVLPRLRRLRAYSERRGTECATYMTCARTTWRSVGYPYPSSLLIQSSSQKRRLLLAACMCAADFFFVPSDERYHLSWRAPRMRN
jgi:hypothetical protein